MRFEDSPNLFGAGGVGTYGDIECEFCGKVYDGREKDRGDGDMEYSDDTISFTTFAGKQVCGCCFEKIEDEVLRRMDDIIPWYIKILKMEHKNIHICEDAIERLKKEIIKNDGQKEH